jgi:hypothetical protein
VDVELSMATDGIACALDLGRLVPASEMGGTGLTVFSGWEVVRVVGITTGTLVANVRADSAPAPPVIIGAVEVGMIAAEDGCVLRTDVVVDGLDVGTTAMEGALCAVVVVGKTLVGGIAGTEALCTVPATADATVENSDAPGTTVADEE